MNFYFNFYLHILLFFFYSSTFSPSELEEFFHATEVLDRNHRLHSIHEIEKNNLKNKNKNEYLKNGNNGNGNGKNGKNGNNNGNTNGNNNGNNNGKKGKNGKNDDNNFRIWNESEEHSVLIAIKALRCKEPSLISALLNDRSVEEVKLIIHSILSVFVFIFLIIIIETNIISLQLLIHIFLSI